MLQAGKERLWFKPCIISWLKASRSNWLGRPGQRAMEAKAKIQAPGPGGLSYRQLDSDSAVRQEAGWRLRVPLCPASRSRARAGRRASASPLCAFRIVRCHPQGREGAEEPCPSRNPTPAPCSFMRSVKALRSLPCMQIKIISRLCFITDLPPSMFIVACSTLQFSLNVLLSYSCEQSSLSYRH